MKKSYSVAALTVILWSTLATISKVLLNNLDVMFVLDATSVNACYICVQSFSWKFKAV